MMPWPVSLHFLDLSPGKGDFFVFVGSLRGMKVEQLFAVLDVMAGNHYLVCVAREEMPIHNFPIAQGYFIMGELVVVLVGFDSDEGESQAEGASMKEFEPIELVHLQRG